MNRREAERFLAALRELRATGQRAATAVVVRVHGSAYRREGTRMLIRPDGTYECALSGGCLEPAVAAAANQVLESGTPALVKYDLGDESVWGLNLGCGGAVDVLIERLDDDEATEGWLAVLERGDAAVFVTALAGVVGRRLVPAAGHPVGHLSDARVEREADERARVLLSLDPPGAMADRIGAAELFFELHTPPPELVVFGAGQDASPVARLGWTLGFSVTVVDSRASSLRAPLFPGARLVLAPFDDLPSHLQMRPTAHVVVMNHHLERDRAALRFALERDAAYIGVLGPRARFEQLLVALRQEGFVPPSHALSRVHSPVGLALGAETPEEVAVSIMAEVLARRQGFDGGPLNGSDSRLHRPASMRRFARS